MPGFGVIFHAVRNLADMILELMLFVILGTMNIGQFSVNVMIREQQLINLPLILLLLQVESLLVTDLEQKDLLAVIG